MGGRAGTHAAFRHQETPRQAEVEALFRRSDAHSRALYPPESNHLVPIEALARPEVRFFVARRQGQVIGCAALVRGSEGTADLKRMFVDMAARGLGAGRALLEAVEQIAQRDGVNVVQLETGVHNGAALALYRRHGYRERPPFGHYAADPLSIFMEKTLGAAD